MLRSVGPISADASPSQPSWELRVNVSLESAERQQTGPGSSVEPEFCRFGITQLATRPRSRSHAAPRTRRGLHLKRAQQPHTKPRLLLGMHAPPVRLCRVGANRGLFAWARGTRIPPWASILWASPWPGRGLLGAEPPRAGLREGLLAGGLAANSDRGIGVARGSCGGWGDAVS